ncbi:MAG: pectin acetylesterase-family hydrolase [Nannocystaceae bacterium]
MPRPAHRSLLPLLASATIGALGCAGDDTSTGASEGATSTATADTTAVSDSDATADTADASTGDATGETTGDGVVYDGAPLPAGEPGEWIWVDFPDASCRSGSPTGIGVRYGASDNLLIYLQGGGACFNTLTCLNNPGSYDSLDFADWSGSWGRWGIFNQDRPENPVADWSVVYIPYCSGDVFAGDREGVTIDEQPDTMDFVGHRNIGAFLQRVVPTFADAPEVLVTGASAGGFGGGFNFVRVADAFASSAITFVDDSAPILGDDYVAPCLQQQWRDLWGLTETLPAGCDACTGPDGGGLTNIATYIAEAVPRANLGLISSTRDGTISIFYAFGVDGCSGFGTMPGGVFEAGLYEYRATQLSPSGWASYFIPSTEHVWTQNSDFYDTEVGGVLLTDWLAELLAGEAAEVEP